MAAVIDRIAIISDVHGNLTALEAVLNHIHADGITRIFNLGDLVGKGPRSAKALDRCREVCEVTVQGNWDINVATLDHPRNTWHRMQIGAERVDYLTNLPGTFDFVLSGRRVRLFHASPFGVHTRIHQDDPRNKHRSMFENTDFTGHGPVPDIVGYGDVHDAFSLAFESRVLFNAGSVGNPLDLPLAAYAVLEGRYGDERPSPWRLSFVRLPYDIESEIAVAKASGMPDFDYYANELRTAKYRGKT